jgi:hypothetical protein
MSYQGTVAPPSLLASTHPPFTVLLFFLQLFLSGSQNAKAQDAPLDLLADQLKRRMQALKTQEITPYFISFAALLSAISRFAGQVL